MKKVSVSIITYNRPRLLRQTIKTLLKNTSSQLDIAVVDNASTDGETQRYLEELQSQGTIKNFRFDTPQPLGLVRNKSESMFDSDSEYIHFCDDDIYYEPNWDLRLIEVLEKCPEVGIVGGLKHPHHQTIESKRISQEIVVYYVNNQPGYSLFIRREDFKKFGPFTVRELGLYGADDSYFCQMCQEQGYKVAAVFPPVIYHCGVISTNGLHTAGFEEIYKNKSLKPELYVE